MESAHDDMFDVQCFYLIESGVFEYLFQIFETIEHTSLDVEVFRVLPILTTRLGSRFFQLYTELQNLQRPVRRLALGYRQYLEFIKTHQVGYQMFSIYAGMMGINEWDPFVQYSKGEISKLDVFQNCPPLIDVFSIDQSLENLSSEMSSLTTAYDF